MSILCSLYKCDAKKKFSKTVGGGPENTRNIETSSEEQSKRGRNVKNGERN